MSQVQELNFLQQKAKEWAEKVVILYNSDFPPELMQKKIALIERARQIKDAIEKITGPLPYLSNISTLSQTGLGFIPILVGVSIAAAVGFIGKWTYDYNILMKFREDRDAFIKGGMTPQAAVNLALQNTKAKGALLPTLSMNSLLLPALALGAFFIFTRMRKN